MCTISIHMQISLPFNSYVYSYINKQIVHMCVWMPTEACHTSTGAWVLAPLLFLCYINDLPHSIHSNIRLYTDDAGQLIHMKVVNLCSKI